MGDDLGYDNADTAYAFAAMGLGQLLNRQAVNVWSRQLHFLCSNVRHTLVLVLCCTVSGVYTLVKLVCPFGLPSFPFHHDEYP